MLVWIQKELLEMSMDSVITPVRQPSLLNSEEEVSVVLEALVEINRHGPSANERGIGSTPFYFHSPVDDNNPLQMV